MNVFPAKLVAVIAVYLLLGVSLTTSARLPDGWKASSLHLSHRIDGSGKITAKKHSFGFGNLDISDRDIVPTRNLRSTSRTSPPAPVKSKPTAMHFSAPPPSVV